MQNRIIIANWKMNKTFEEGKRFIKKMLNVEAFFSENIKVILAVPFTHIDYALKLLHDSSIILSAQNCHHKYYCNRHHHHHHNQTRKTLF